MWGRAFWRPVPEVTDPEDERDALQTESGRPLAVRRRAQQEARRRVASEEAARLPIGMVGATTAIVAIGLLLTFAAGPIYALTDQAAANLMDRSVYVDAVLDAGVPAPPGALGAGEWAVTGVRRLHQRAVEIRGDAGPDGGGWRAYVITLTMLTLVWMALWGSASLIVILLGIAVGALILLLFPLPTMYFRFGIHPWRMLVLLVRFLWDVVVASVQVSWLAIRPRLPQPEVTTVQLASDSDLLEALTALAVSLVPGSLIIDADSEDRTLTIHVLDPGKQTMESFADQVRAQEHRIRLALGDYHDDVTNPLTTPRLPGRAARDRADDAHPADRRPAVRRGSGLRRGAAGPRPHPDRPRGGAGRHAGDRGGRDRAARGGVRTARSPWSSRSSISLLGFIGSAGLAKLLPRDRR